jgi:hypothetical protein
MDLHSEGYTKACSSHSELWKHLSIALMIEENQETLGEILNARFSGHPVLKVRLATHRQHCLSIIVINTLMPFRERTDVYRETRTKHTKARTLCAKHED